MSERWEETTVHKPGPELKTLGPAFTSAGRPRKVPSGEGPKAAHGKCVEHLNVPGLRSPVCVLRGQDPTRVAAEARELAGLPPLEAPSTPSKKRRSS